MRIGRASRFIPLRVKFMFLFFVLISVPFIVIGAITYSKYSTDVEKDAENYTFQIVDQIRIYLDKYIKDIERITLAPLYDNKVLDVMRKHSDQPYQKDLYLTSEEQVKLNLFISSFAFERNEIERILIFTNDGGLFSPLESVYKNWNPESNQWMDTVRTADGAMTIIPPHAVKYDTKQTERVVSIARLIRDPLTKKSLGMIKVDLNSESFESIFSAVRFSPNGKLYIADENGDFFYPQLEGADRIGLQKQLTEQQERYLIASTRSEYSGLNIIGQIPLNDLQKNAKELIRFTLMISIITIILALLLAVFISSKLVKPIRHLQSKMKLVQIGAFYERATVTSNDEIGLLTDGFNRMISEIDHLVKEVYETKIREREAELSLLQRQMNPHFLYNTLESINLMAINNKQFALSDVISDLGKLLRYTVDKRNRSVFLKDEADFIEAYLELQSSRYGEKFKTEIFIDPSLERCLVPKLILQPLVENVIEHAMGDDPLTILIDSRVEGEDLLLTVWDDGVGIEREKLDRLREQINEDSPEQEFQRYGEVKKGFALRNVHRRIRILYGSPYGLTIESEPGTGTLITIQFPLKWEE